MDPQACWDEIKAILARGGTTDWDTDDIQDLAERLECLAAWVRGGGFWPKP